MRLMSEIHPVADLGLVRRLRIILRYLGCCFSNILGSSVTMGRVSEFERFILSVACIIHRVYATD